MKEVDARVVRGGYDTESATGGEVREATAGRMGCGVEAKETAAAERED